MKIAIICLNLGWQAGGVRLIYSQAHAMKKLGNQVVIYAPEVNEFAYPDLRAGLDIRIVPPPEPILWQYSARNLIGRIKEKLKRGRILLSVSRKISDEMESDFDIVNLHDFSYQLAPIYKQKNPKAKIIWTMNDPPYMYLPKSSFIYDIASRFFNWYKDFSEKKFFKSIDSVVVLVDRNKVWAENRGMKAKVVWSGLEFERFFSPAKTLDNKKSFSLLGVGALNKYRRFEDLISAVRILRDRGVDARATVICKNIWQEDAYAEELKSLVAKENIRPYVDLKFEGASSDEELKELYASSDFFILPIHLPPPRDGFGWQLVPFEAMAAGTPVIASRKIDITEALKDGETACFVDPLSPSQIAEKVEMLVKNPALYGKISSVGQKFVREKMSWENYSREIISST